MNDTDELEIRADEPVTSTVTFVDYHQPETDPHEKAREAAFDATYMWDGRPLEPLSSGRRREWARMRAHEGNDPTFMDDAVKVLWLCHQTESDILAKRRNLTAMCDEAWKWGDKNIPHTRHEEMLDLVNRMFDDAELTRAVPIPSDGGQLGN
jgi:hypothetical protein